MRPIYSDESIWFPVSKGLRNRGWTVYTAHEEDNLGDADTEQLRLARENNWIMLTFDDDFLSLIEKEKIEHSGIIYVNQAGKRIGDVVKTVDRALQENEELNEIIYL